MDPVWDKRRKDRDAAEIAAMKAKLAERQTVEEIEGVAVRLQLDEHEPTIRSAWLDGYERETSPFLIRLDNWRARVRPYLIDGPNARARERCAARSPARAMRPDGMRWVKL
jgi:hypothetical protein